MINFKQIRREALQDPRVIALGMVPVICLGVCAIAFLNYRADLKLRSGDAPPEAFGDSFSDRIATPNPANASLTYHVYIPRNSGSKPLPVLVYVGGFGGEGSVVRTMWADFAEKNRIAVVGPSFQPDDNDRTSLSSYRYPKVWSGFTVKMIIAGLSATHPVNPREIYLWGFSAGAQFVERFALLYSEDCKAAVVIAGGGYTLPGEKVATKFFLTVGGEDRERLKKALWLKEVADRLGIFMALHVEDHVGHRVSANQSLIAKRFLEEEIRNHRAQQQ